MKRGIFFIKAVLFLLLLSSCQTKTSSYTFKVPADKRNQSQELIAFQPRPLNNYTTKELIVIDAGHGGEDAGTRSLTPPKYEEKSLNLATAFFLKEFLQKMGYVVKMTRSEDLFVPLAKRSSLANGWQPKLFVSVHYNAAESERADGIEVYYYQSEENKQRSTSSKKLADAVLAEVIQKTGAKSRGVKHGNLSVVRETLMPAILVEGGFMTNKNEMEKIKDPGYIKKLAFGIALGIDRYMKSERF
ncbi:MAG TPA: N-acetylmuramoyl-L-alanine amidase [Parachlamydiaceae bacterium]|nr:N-acetylmuramoyl-L-alanine amidase [Parachlamydiaceae bacterium]